MNIHSHLQMLAKQLLGLHWSQCSMCALTLLAASQQHLLELVTKALSVPFQSYRLAHSVYAAHALHVFCRCTGSLMFLPATHATNCAYTIHGSGTVPEICLLLVHLTRVGRIL